jgi:hypothetical protein
VAETTTVKTLLRCGFRRTGKAMGQVYQCCGRICREIDGFARFESHLFTDSLSYFGHGTLIFGITGFLDLVHCPVF